MPSLNRLLARLERYDTYPAEDALNLALEEILGAAPPSSGDPAKDQELLAAHEAAQVASRAMAEQWKQTPGGQEGWRQLVAFAEQRLTHWHSIKYAAVHAAFHADPSGQNSEAMIRAVLIDLRQGIHDQPQLLPDAHFLQALAQGRHSFSWTQAVKELQQDGVPLPSDPAQLRPFCAIPVFSFKWIVQDGVRSS